MTQQIRSSASPIAGVQVPNAEAKRFACQVLEAVGATEEHARLTVDNLTFADRSGLASHGLLRLPLYAEAAHRGGINVSPEMRWVHTHPGGGLLDAGGAFGQVAMHQAVDYATQELQHSASVVVAVQSSCHFGAGGYWVNMLAEKGYVSFAFSTAAAIVTPFGGKKKVMGTNPLSISLPTEESHPMTMDMATSTGAYGKVVAARNAGLPIPEGWAVDADGSPTTDPEEALAGALTPFGGHKGSGLSVALEGLSASLTHADFSYETEDIWIDPASQMNTGHTLIAINPGAFAGEEHTRHRVSGLRREVRDSGDSVLAPGDLEAQSRAETSEYLDLAPSTVELLHEAAERWNVPALRTS